jgi:hypothetical protein
MPTKLAADLLHFTELAIWARPRASLGNLAGSLSQEQAREQLAKRIMRAVDQGDTDQERLTLIAIKFFDSRVQAD